MPEAARSSPRPLQPARAEVSRPELASRDAARPAARARLGAGHQLAALTVKPPTPARAAPALSASPPGAGVVQLFRFGSLFGDWKGKAAGVATALGTAALVGGTIASAPLVAVGGLVAAGVGGGFLRRRYQQAQQPRLSIPLGGQEEEVRQAAGDDPNIRIENGRLLTSYSGQQLRDQYSRGRQMGESTLFTLLRGLNPHDGPISSAAPSLNRTFGNPFWNEVEARERRELTQRAQRRANTFNFERARQRERVRSEGLEHDLKGSGSGLEDAQRLLGTQQGLAFGEDHSQHHTKGFLSANLGALTREGVNTLYLEAIRSDYQQHVDRYLENGTMSPELERYVTAMDRTHGADGGTGASLRGLLGAARLHGVRVRSIDSVAAASAETSERGSEPIRDALMNQFGEEAIRGDRARGRGKYVILAGQAHNVEQQGTDYSRRQGFRGPIPGFSQLLDIPAVQVDPERGRLHLDRGDSEEEKKSK